MVDRMMMVQHCLYGTKTLRRGGQARTKDYAQPSLGTDALRPGGKGSAETINGRNTSVATRNIRLRGKPIIQIIQRKRAYAAAVLPAGLDTLRFLLAGDQVRQHRADGLQWTWRRHG